MQVFFRNNRVGLLANVLGAVALTLVLNGIIYAAGWNTADNGRVEPEFAPPGWVIGSVWIALFAMMGAAHWLVATIANASGARRWVVALIVACAVYPFYTGGLDSLYPAFAGAVITCLLAVVSAVVTRRHSSRASALLVPVVAWTLFASALTLRSIQLN